MTGHDRDCVLVPLQGRALDRRIIDHLSRGWLHVGHEVVLLGVVEPEADSADQATALRDTRERLIVVRDTLRDRGVTATARLVIGDPDDELLEQVERLAPAFVVAVVGEEGPAPALLRAERLGLRGRVPVLIAHAQLATTSPLRTVLVRLDGSAEDLRALPLVGALARRHGAEVLLVRPEWDESDEVTKLRSPREVAAALEPVRRDLEGCCGVRARTVVVYGPDAPQLLAVAEREDVDLVVVSSRGRLAGSPAEQVLLRSTRPLLVFRAPAPASSGCARLEARGGGVCPFHPDR